MTLSTVLLAGLVMLGGAAADTAEPESKPPTEAESEALLRTLVKHQADHRARCLENIHVEFEFSYLYEKGLSHSALGADDGPAKGTGTGIRIRQGANRYLENQSVRVFTRDGTRQEGRFFGVVNAEYVATAMVDGIGVLRVSRVDHEDPEHLSERAKSGLVLFDAPGLFEAGYTDGLLSLERLVEAALADESLTITARPVTRDDARATHEVRVRSSKPAGLDVQMLIDGNRGFLGIDVQRTLDGGEISVRLAELQEFAPGCWFARKHELEWKDKRVDTADTVTVTRVERPGPVSADVFTAEHLAKGFEKVTMRRFFMSGREQWYKREAGRWVPTDGPAYWEKGRDWHVR